MARWRKHEATTHGGVVRVALLVNHFRVVGYGIILTSDITARQQIINPNALTIRSGKRKRVGPIRRGTTFDESIGGFDIEIIDTFNNGIMVQGGSGGAQNPKITNTVRTISVALVISI